MEDSAVRHFLPWVRQGAAAGITIPDSLTANQPADVSLQVSLLFASFTAPGKDMKLYGPADVTAIDPRQIVRVQPQPLTTNFESNFFPLIEFDRPDFAWMFTPAKAGLNERLRPWICLVVVRKQEGVTLGRLDTSPSATTLEIRSPARVAVELPDLDESWAWVHAQVVGAATDTLDTLRQAVETAPAHTVGRLLCPRRLDPDVTYIACVVPTFDVGRKAGLGLPVTEDERKTLAPSWSPQATEILLPVYHSWQFTTGPQGDFESLVRDLTPRPLPDTVGKRPLDVREPGFGLPRSTDAILPMKGILKPPEPATTVPSPVPGPLKEKLADLLNIPSDALSATPAADPIVAPPIYGSTYPPLDRVSTTNTPPHWINELNLDPRDRVAASMGTRIVQEDQEHLMASAWQQVDAINKANQERRRQRLAQAGRVSTFERQVARLGTDRLLQVTGTSLAKVAVVSPEGQRTIAWQLSGSAAPGFESGTLRRLGRPRGPINRRALTAPVVQSLTQARPMVRLLDPLPDVTRVVVVPPVRVPVGTLVTIPKVSAAAGTPAIDAGKLVPASIPATPIPRGQRPQTTVIRDTQGQSQRSIDNNFSAPEPRLLFEFRVAALAHLTKVVRSRFTKLVILRVPDPGTLRTRLNPLTPSAGLTRAARAVIGDPDDEVLAHPRFPAPMSERLIELAPDFLLPGLHDVPANTATLVQPNTRFIEAFMIGLNHEMGRELLWREYPSDRRGSYFRFFWNRRGAAQQQPMAPLPLWNQPLGRNPSGAGSPDQLVLLVRGELFRRYPTAVIYAAKASGTPTDPKLTTQETYPLFRGSAPPDVTFFGFDLAEAAARGTDTDPGWFFVIQQQAGEPDFGLDLPKDVNPQPPRVTDWSQLTWRHLVASAAELAALAHVKVKPGTPPLPDTSANPPGAVWGHNGAHMARITLQKPVRIAILARQMLPPK